jgi:hypothetical protein
MKKFSGVAALFALAIVVLSGCGDSPSESEKESTAYSDLDEKGVLLAVDGVSLTKEEAERRLDLEFALLRISGEFIGDIKNPKVRAPYLRRISGQFVSESILANAARASETVPSAEAIRYAQNKIVSSYGSEGMSFDDFSNRIPANLRESFNSSMEIGALIYEYLKSQAGEAANVSEKDIDEIVELGRQKEAESEKVLSEQRQKADEIYARLLNGEEFAEVAKESFTAEEDNYTGDWGEFTPAALEATHPGIAKELLGLQPGEFTKPLELDDAIYIVQLSRREGEGAQSVFNSNPEKLDLKRIIIPLPVLYGVASRDEIREALISERLVAFQKDRLLPGLFEKAKLEYPNGLIVFGDGKAAPMKKEVK